MQQAAQIMKINSPAATNFTVICTIGRKYLKIIRVIFYLATNSSIWRCWQTSYDVARLRLTWVQKYFGSKEILGPKQFWVQKNFGSKTILGPKQFWVPIFWVQKILCPKNFWYKEILGPQKCSPKQILFFQRILGPNKFWVQKKF